MFLAPAIKKHKEHRIYGAILRRTSARISPQGSRPLNLICVSLFLTCVFWEMPILGRKKKRPCEATPPPSNRAWKSQPLGGPRGPRGPMRPYGPFKGYIAKSWNLPNPGFGHFFIFGLVTLRYWVQVQDGGLSFGNFYITRSCEED